LDIRVFDNQLAVARYSQRHTRCVRGATIIDGSIDDNSCVTLDIKGLTVCGEGARN
jgi:hypothetical protein